MSVTLRREQNLARRAQTPGEWLARASRAVSEATARPVSKISQASATPPVRSMSHGPVFSINFIRRQTLPMSVRRVLVWLGMGYVVANVVLCLMLLGIAAGLHRRAHTLHAQLPQSTPAAITTVRSEMEVLHQRAATQFNELTAVVAQQQQRVPLAGKLSALTNTIPPRTWITGLSGEQKDRTMVIHAAYLIDPEHPYELPTKAWVDALKADPAFGQHLSHLDIKRSSRATQGTRELFVFDLDAQWQPASAQ